MHITGEKPGTGVYDCILCGESVFIDDSTGASDTLPSCPKCGNFEFVRVK